jgi:hypothetical protein
MTSEEAFDARRQAQMDLYWHLQRAAALVFADCNLGTAYFEVMNQVSEAQGRWKAAHDAWHEAEDRRHREWQQKQRSAGEKA